MNRESKIEFIDDLVENVRQAIIAKVDDMPEEWDGHELRRYLADKFSGAAYMWQRLPATRKREYENAILIKNL